jgi:hypothetical protein
MIVTLLQLCRRIVCSVAQGDRPAACSQMTGILHFDLAVSSPRRRIDRRLRAGVAWRNFMDAFPLR